MKSEASEGVTADVHASFRNVGGISLAAAQRRGAEKEIQWGCTRSLPRRCAAARNPDQIESGTRPTSKHPAHRFSRAACDTDMAHVLRLHHLITSSLHHFPYITSPIHAPALPGYIPHRVLLKLTSG